MMVKEQLITKEKTHALVRYFAVLVLLLTVESLAQNGNAFRNPEINIPPSGDRPDGIIEVDAVFD